MHVMTVKSCGVLYDTAGWHSERLILYTVICYTDWCGAHALFL